MIAGKEGQKKRQSINRPTYASPPEMSPVAKDLPIKWTTKQKQLCSVQANVIIYETTITLTIIKRILSTRYSMRQRGNSIQS